MSPECIHRWLIATPNGPTSPGQCRNCGAEREFLNADPADVYGGASDLTIRRSYTQRTRTQEQEQAQRLQHSTNAARGMRRYHGKEA